LARGWRLYYEDGSTFSSDDGPPWQSPAWGCVLVTQKVPGDESLHLSFPHYLHRTDLDQWINVDDAGLIDQLAHYGHLIDCYRPGRMLPTAAWKAVVARGNADRGV